MKRHDANGESASPSSSVAPAVPTTGHFDVNAAYAAAAKCEHLLQGVCLTCVGVSLAAAEERGFGRGIERAATALRNTGYDHAARIAEAQLPFAPPVPEELRK